MALIFLLSDSERKRRHGRRRLRYEGHVRFGNELPQAACQMEQAMKTYRVLFGASGLLVAAAFTLGVSGPAFAYGTVEGSSIEALKTGSDVSAKSDWIQLAEGGDGGTGLGNGAGGGGGGNGTGGNTGNA